ncbi:hypothetical protein EHYA_04550 [Embleya hyalina]|uniref:Uncharacterized protein n=1 Tax=Embleya hyalina TaxID=516124 RepID=A0A401YQK1_9ACTN|nr:hypothetical protein EHYA_04550 [Embleya hyalina]
MVGTQSASAASGCYGSGPRVRDGNGNLQYTRYCYAYLKSNMYDWRYGASPTAIMEAGESWFVCQSYFPGHENPWTGNDRRNYWWLWSQGDTKWSHNGWGWFPANRISGAGTGAAPGLRVC